VKARESRIKPIFGRFSGAGGKNGLDLDGSIKNPLQAGNMMLVLF
jgi:hypothetical protein